MIPAPTKWTGEWDSTSRTTPWVTCFQVVETTISSTPDIVLPSRTYVGHSGLRVGDQRRPWEKLIAPSGLPCPEGREQVSSGTEKSTVGSAITPTGEHSRPPGES